MLLKNCWVSLRRRWMYLPWRWFSSSNLSRRQEIFFITKTQSIFTSHSLVHMCYFSDCDENYVGDGYCDDPLNIPSCNFDGGDCCLPSKIVDFCHFCECFNETNYVTPMPFWKTTTVEPMSKNCLLIFDFYSTSTKSHKSMVLIH